MQTKLTYPERHGGVHWWFTLVVMLLSNMGTALAYIALLTESYTKSEETIFGSNY